MSSPLLGSDITETQLEITWAALTGTDSGNSDILGYQLYWDAQTGTSDILLVETTSLSHLQASLSPGLPYKFKVRARNIYGTGAFSLEVVFTPINEPATMQPVVTVLNHPNIELSFVEPDDSGLPILDYEIAFFDKDQNGYRTVTTLCNGLDSSLLVTSTPSCTFSVANVITELGYARGELLLAKARARNAEGFGQFSSPNSSGARIETVPVLMGDPQVTSYTTTTITLSWAELLFDNENGASAITSYKLEWDQGTGNYDTLIGDPVNSLATTFEGRKVNIK